jgi:hypothetical protein
MSERALNPGYVKLPPSTVGFGGPLVSPKLINIAASEELKVTDKLSALIGMKKPGLPPGFPPNGSKNVALSLQCVDHRKRDNDQRQAHQKD